MISISMVVVVMIIIDYYYYCYYYIYISLSLSIYRCIHFLYIKCICIKYMTKLNQYIIIESINTITFILDFFIYATYLLYFNSKPYKMIYSFKNY